MSGPSGRRLAELVADRRHDRLLQLSFPQRGEPAGGDLVVNTIFASEGLSRDFDFTAGLLSSNAGLALRYFTGIVFEFRLVRTDGNPAFYEARLGPWLKYLRLCANNCFFHRQTLAHRLRDDAQRLALRESADQYMLPAMGLRLPPNIADVQRALQPIFAPAPTTLRCRVRAPFSHPAH